MNLFDSSRPKILHKLAFLPGNYPIPQLQIWPLNNDLIEIAMMLPINGNQFTGKWFTKQINKNELNITVNALIEDPELFVETNFGQESNNESSHFTPAIQINKNQTKQNPNPKPNKNQNLSLLIDEEE